MSIPEDENRQGSDVGFRRDIDWFLQTLVGLANAKAMSCAITLGVGGWLISGQLIGGKRYFTLWAEAFERGIQMTPGESVSKADPILKAIEVLDGIYEKPADDPVMQNPSYIHLEDARFFGAGLMTPSSEGVLWRGKLASVDGFWLGQLRQD